MAVNSPNRRQSAMLVALPFRGVLPLPDATVEERDRYFLGKHYSGFALGNDPVLIEQVPNIAVAAASGGYSYQLGAYFTGATSYAISPSVEVGWAFNTSTGQLDIDTDATAVFGPYTVTATNSNGSKPSNTFTVSVINSTAPPRTDPRFGYAPVLLTHYLRH